MGQSKLLDRREIFFEKQSSSSLVIATSSGTHKHSSLSDGREVKNTEINKPSTIKSHNTILIVARVQRKRHSKNCTGVAFTIHDNTIFPTSYHYNAHERSKTSRLLPRHDGASVLLVSHVDLCSTTPTFDLGDGPHNGHRSHQPRSIACWHFRLEDDELFTHPCFKSCFLASRNATQQQRRRPQRQQEPL